MDIETMKCSFCSTIKNHYQQEQWWNLTNYYGFSGIACNDCYNKIAHDSFRNPVNPEEYTLMLLKHTKGN